MKDKSDIRSEAQPEPIETQAQQLPKASGDLASPAAAFHEAAPPTGAEAPRSEALRDIQEAGLTPEEAFLAAKNNNAANQAQSEPKALATVPKFRWVLLFVLSLAAVLAWALEAQLSSRPYQWAAWIYLAATVIITVPTVKFLRLPTRAGLAALAWAGTFVVSALYGPAETVFSSVPAALVWSIVLTMAILWILVAVWRKLGRYKALALILSILLIYAALSPVWTLAQIVLTGYKALSFPDLCASPYFISARLPWFIWPMSFCLGALVLGALLSLWDQCSSLRRKGARHGGNIFLALAFILLLPYGFLTFGQAVSEIPQLADGFRSLYPAAQAWPPAPASPPAAETPALSESPELSAPAEPPAEALEPLKAAETAEAEAITETDTAAPAPPEAAAGSSQPAPQPEADAAAAELEALKQSLENMKKRLESLETQLRELKGPAVPPSLEAPAQEGEPPFEGPFSNT